MKTRYLLDPELHPLVDGPDVDLNPDTLPGLRQARAADVVMGDAQAAGITRHEVFATGTRDVRCLLYAPDDSPGTRPGYLHIHGGGYCLGSPEMSDLWNVIVARKLGIVICSVDYRLAPEHPVPAPMDDCYTALAWFHDNADRWDVDTRRIAIGGESAGGGLAAALAIHARDLGDYAICHQHLTYPMLDNLTGTAAQPGDPLTGEFIWTREKNQFGWDCYLGEAPAVSPQVPARLDDFSGLPPTWMFTAGLDLFRDENIRYAQSLLAAGVPTELFVLPGACHGFQGLPGTTLGKRYRNTHLAALAKGLSCEVR